MDSDRDDLNAEALRLIETARKAQTPDDATRRRVRNALAVGLGAAAVGTGPGAALAVSKKGMALFAGVRGVVATIVVASVGVAAGWWAHDLSRRSDGQAQPREPGTTPVPVQVDPPPALAAPDSLLDELTLLQQAQQALGAGQARQALVLARRHAERYPHSQLGLERGALEVFANCALGRKTEARTLATALLAQAPRTPLRTSLEDSCAMR